MAGNPFDAFDAKPANPFDAFDPKPAAATPPAASTPAAGPSTSPTWTDYLLQHLANAPKAADDFVRAATDAMTFGYGDKAIGALTGQNEAALTQQSRQRLGTVGNVAADVTGYAMGPGELGAASKIGGAIAPTLAKLPFTGAGKWLGGVLGSAAEGAGAGALGAAGHDEDIGQGATWGGLLGGAGGTLGGVVGRGGASAPPRTVDDLRAAAKAKYAGNDPVMFDGPGTVHPAFAAADDAVARANLTGQQFDLAKSTKAALSDFRDKPQFTATDLDKAQGRFDKIASSPTSTDQDKWIAPYYSAAIEDVMKNGTPFNAPTGWAAETRNAADKLHGMAEDTQRLNDWIDNSNIGGKGKGPDVGAQAKSWLLSNEGKKYAPQGTPRFDAFNTLAQTAQKPLTGAEGVTLWDLKHHLLWPAIGLAGAQTAGAFGTTEGHQPWWANIPEDIAGLGAGFLVKNRLGAYGALAQQRAIDAARTTASTGQFQAPVQPLTPLRNAIRDAIYGRGAGGGY